MGQIFIPSLCPSIKVDYRTHYHFSYLWHHSIFMSCWNFGRLVPNSTDLEILVYTGNVRNESHLPSKERQDWGEANNEYTPLVHSNMPDSKSELVSDVHLIQPSVQERGFFVRFLLCFSITRNTSKIMDCSVPPGAITPVNGVRVLSLWWIILGHTYSAFVTSGILNDILLGLNIVHRFTFGTISNAFFAVDSFFVLRYSRDIDREYWLLYRITNLHTGGVRLPICQPQETFGLLVAYLSFRRMEQNDGKLPLFKFYFHRFWRLTPSYMFVILFYSNLYAFLGEGPYWFSSQNSTLCEKYWWTNLLYINNFYPTNSGNQCLGWSWYLANDMQFYIISPLVIFLVKRFKWKGVFASVGGLLGISFVVTAVIIDYYELKVILFGRGGGEPHLKQNGAENNFSDLLYIKPYCRISPYLVGMVLGYLIHAEESAHRLSPLRKIPRQIVCLVGWFVATGLGVAVVYGIYPSTKKGGTPFNKAENITYGSFSRFTWGLALAWVIYACNKGYGSLVNKFLSASYWIPLSRLTYSAYLLHVIVLQDFFASFHHTTEYTDELWAFYFVAAVAMTYAAAFLLTVCVEFPVMQLENTFFFRNKK